MSDLAEDEGAPRQLTEQILLAASLERLAVRLRRQQAADPVLGLETALAALAAIRVWLSAECVTGALQTEALSQDQLERWEYQLSEDLAYLRTIAEAVASRASASLPN